MSRFVIPTTCYSQSVARDRLERAAARVERSAALSDIEVVVGENRHLAVVIDVRGRGRRAARRAEGVFRALWYDAFGDSGAGIVPRLVEPGRSGASREDGGRGATGYHG